jgi:hypothetical protein
MSPSFNLDDSKNLLINDVEKIAIVKQHSHKYKE